LTADKYFQLTVSGCGNKRHRPKQKYATSVPEINQLILQPFNFLKRVWYAHFYVHRAQFSVQAMGV
jgi:hypothetical protein